MSCIYNSAILCALNLQEMRTFFQNTKPNIFALVFVCMQSIRFKNRRLSTNGSQTLALMKREYRSHDIL